MASVLRIAREDQIRALAEPHRAGIVRRLMAAPATISQLGVAFDRHPAWIRHHVKALEAVGLVQLVEERVTRNFTEKYYGAAAPAFLVESVFRAEEADGGLPLAFASSDFAMSLLARGTHDHATALTAVTGSLDSLIALRQGLADIAGCHLLDAPSGDYNVPYVRHLFPDRSVTVTTLAHREQGLIVAPGNPMALRDIDDIAQAGVRFINRNKGSGTRVWLDSALRQRGIDGDAVLGYADEVATHGLAASAVATGAADVTLGIRAAADRHELGFVPLFVERYDLVIPTERVGDSRLDPLLSRLHSQDFLTEAQHLCGYDTTETGREFDLAV